MGSGPLPWKTALTFSAFFFLVGFLAGVMPPLLSGSDDRPAPVDVLFGAEPVAEPEALLVPAALPGEVPTDRSPLTRRPLIIVVTTTEHDSGGAAWPAAALTRLGHTLRLVAPPLLWLVVTPEDDEEEMARLIRPAGVVHRQITFAREGAEAAGVADERRRQRNLALGHLARCRIAGVVAFASWSDFFDLQFFDQMRQIENFTAWLVLNVTLTMNEESIDPTKLQPYEVAFNSSILWTREDRLTQTSETNGTQDYMKYVEDLELDNEMKFKNSSADCSRILSWRIRYDHAGR